MLEAFLARFQLIGERALSLNQLHRSIPQRDSNLDANGTTQSRERREEKILHFKDWPFVKEKPLACVCSQKPDRVPLSFYAPNPSLPDI